MVWLEKQGGEPGSVRFESLYDVSKASSLFRDQAKDWRPGMKVPSWFEADVCIAGARDAGISGEFYLKYGPSILPFDEPITGSTIGGSELIEVPVNTDVRLLKRIGDNDIQYVVFVRCGIRGAKEGQLNGLPLEGYLFDTLTDSDERVHFTHLLHSAKVMAKAIGCENKPVVPAEPPASVK
jgi:hypothetical protein